jgi:hypothetical protein
VIVAEAQAGTDPMMLRFATKRRAAIFSGKIPGFAALATAGSK